MHAVQLFEIHMQACVGNVTAAWATCHMHMPLQPTLCSTQINAAECVPTIYISKSNIQIKECTDASRAREDLNAQRTREEHSKFTAPHSSHAVNMSSRYKNCWTCTVYCLAHWVTWVSTVKADWSPSFVLRV